MSIAGQRYNYMNEADPITWDAKNALLGELARLQPLYRKALAEHERFQVRENIGSEAVTDEDLGLELECALKNTYYEGLICFRTKPVVDDQPDDPFAQSLAEQLREAEASSPWAEEQELLAKYARRIPKRFTQIDCFGSEIFSGNTTELMHGSDVRVLIAKDTSQDEAVKILKDIRKVVKLDSDFNAMPETSGYKSVSMTDRAFLK